VLLLWISGRFRPTFVVSASLLIQTLRKRGPSRENIFSRPFRISLAKNKKGSRIPRATPFVFFVYSLFKYSKNVYSLAKGRPSLELYLRLPLTCLRKVISQKAPQAESLRKRCNFISWQSLSKIAAWQGSRSIYSFLQQFSDCNTSTGEINKRWLKFKGNFKNKQF